MLKFLSFLCVITLITTLQAGVATEHRRSNCNVGLFGQAVVCIGSISSESTGSDIRPIQRSTSPVPVPETNIFYFAEILLGAYDLWDCYIFEPVRITKVYTAGLLSQFNTMNEKLFPPCFRNERPGLTVDINPELLAKRFFDTIPLPVPKPSVPPGYAVTGKIAYLLAGDSNDPPSWHRTTPLGVLTVTAHGTYTINWGDGTPTTTSTSPGAAYPDGTIVHTYDDTGHYTVTVREDWTATWSVGAAHGTLSGLHTTGTIPDFAVRQIQAVITG